MPGAGVAAVEKVPVRRRSWTGRRCRVAAARHAHRRSFGGRSRLVDTLALSWVLGATDAHAKNYSLLLSGSSVRLAPLYDVNSVLPYLAPQRRGVQPAGSACTPLDWL